MIIDCFTFFNELDLLEIRLNELAPYVDHFVLAECALTHSGKEKPLFYELNKDRFKDFKIIHIIIPSNIETTPRENEIYGKRYLLENVEANPDDMLLISDVDEIPNLKNYKEDEGVFKQEMYLYYLNLHEDKPWRGTFSVKKKNVDESCFDFEGRINYKRKAKVVGNGWHFSAVGSDEFIINKIEASEAQQFNNSSYKRSVILRKKELTSMKLGKFILRELKVGMITCPEWLEKNKDKYSNLFK